MNCKEQGKDDRRHCADVEAKDANTRVTSGCLNRVGNKVYCFAEIQMLLVKRLSTEAVYTNKQKYFGN